jgi:hypothetical protein
MGSYFYHKSNPIGPNHPALPAPHLKKEGTILSSFHVIKQPFKVLPL